MPDTAIIPSGRATLWALALCTLAALSEGFDIQSMGVAAPRMGPELGLTHAQLGPLFSASVVGLLLGSITIGRAADSVGRKWTLIASIATFGVFSAATAFVGGFAPLLLVRFLAGLGLGGAMPNLIALSAETLTARGIRVDRRTRIVTMITAGMPFGGALAGVAAILLSWRGIFFVGAALPLALAPIMALRLAESPGFETSRRKTIVGAEEPGAASGLFGNGRLITTLLLWAATFCALLSLYLLINWLPTLMRAKGVSPRDASLVSVLYNLGGALSAFGLAALMEQRRRAAKLAIWYLGMAGSILLLANAGSDLPSAGGAGFVAGVFIASAALPFYGLAPSYYEVEVRGLGVGAALGVGRSGAIVGPLVAGVLLTGGAGAGVVIMALLPLALAIGASAMTLMGRPTAEAAPRGRIEINS
jgi:AAHS family 3-hydroxyphenylpropionic acid transporter